MRWYERRAKKAIGRHIFNNRSFSSCPSDNLQLEKKLVNDLFYDIGDAKINVAVLFMVKGMCQLSFIALVWNRLCRMMPCFSMTAEILLVHVETEMPFPASFSWIQT